MNEWLTDPRAVRGEELGYEAEGAERDGDFARARDLYRAAATEYASEARLVAVDGCGPQLSSPAQVPGSCFRRWSPPPRRRGGVISTGC